MAVKKPNGAHHRLFSTGRRKKLGRARDSFQGSGTAPSTCDYREREYDTIAKSADKIFIEMRVKDVNKAFRLIGVNLFWFILRVFLAQFR